MMKNAKKDLTKSEIRAARFGCGLICLSAALFGVRLAGWYEAPVWMILAPIWAPMALGLIISLTFGIIVKLKKWKP
jgi:hypothetical protein